MLFSVLAASVPSLPPRFYVRKESPVTSFPFWLSMSTNSSSQSHEMLKRFLVKASVPWSLLCFHGEIVTGPEGVVKQEKVKNRLWDRTGNGQNSNVYFSEQN